MIAPTFVFLWAYSLSTQNSSSTLLNEADPEIEVLLSQQTWVQSDYKSVVSHEFYSDWPKDTEQTIEHYETPLLLWEVVDMFLPKHYVWLLAQWIMILSIMQKLIKFAFIDLFWLSKRDMSDTAIGLACALSFWVIKYFMLFGSAEVSVYEAFLQILSPNWYDCC